LLFKLPSEVRRADHNDFDRLLQFMPDLPGANIPLEAIFVAEQRSQIVGMAAFSVLPYGDRIYGLRGNIYVCPENRRQGVGSALLTCLTHEVSAWQVQVLYSWSPIADPALESCLRKWGFKDAYHIYTFEIFADPTIAALAPRVERLRSRGKIPNDLSIKPLREMNPLAAAGLYAQFFGLPLELAKARLLSLLSDETCSRYSIGIMQNGLLVGVIVWGKAGKLLSVDLFAVDPTWKAPWGPLLLLYESVRLVAQDGHRSAQYRCSDAIKFSIHLAHITGATQINDETSYALNLAK
jgi:GNAT superfamily N-acetyltransferase